MRITQSKQYRVLHDCQFHNSTLNSVNHWKYLGVVFQSNLRWSKHIEEITAKANSTLGMICRNIKKTPKSVREQIYQTLIRPQLEYASSAWSPWLRHDILELEKVQRHAARFVLNNYWPLASVTQMISILDWETLETRRQKARLSMLYKTIMVLPQSQWTTTNPPRLHPPDPSMVKTLYYLPDIPFSLRRSAAGTACPDMPSHQHHYVLLSHLYNCVILLTVCSLLIEVFTV